MADPALVELVISPDHDQPARTRALRLLGFAADLPVRVAAVRTSVARRLHQPTLSRQATIYS
jgi:hypothetical protein